MDGQTHGPSEVPGPAEKQVQVDIASISAQQLFDCLELLPERYQVPLRLHLLEKWSSQSIAQYLNKPLGTVESLLWRGKKRLRKLGILKQACSSQTSKKLINEELTKHIGRLPRPYRGILQSHYVKGQTYVEMAQASGVPIGTLKSRVHRGKKLLFTFFGTETAEEAAQ